MGQNRPYDVRFACNAPDQKSLLRKQHQLNYALQSIIEGHSALLTTIPVTLKCIKTFHLAKSIDKNRIEANLFKSLITRLNSHSIFLNSRSLRFSNHCPIFTKYQEIFNLLLFIFSCKADVQFQAK